MEDEKTFYDDLVKYADILNKYERDNYKLDNEEFDFVKTLVKVKEENPKKAKEIEKIQNMAKSERAKYIENYQKLQEEEKNAKTTEEEIADTFDVSLNNINEETLKDGKTLYVLYSDKLNKDIVLEDGNKFESLTEELKDIKEKNLEENKDLDDIVNDKRINENLEVSFVPINNLKDYISSINNLTPEKLLELDCLVKNATSLGIEYINLDNIIGLDKQGKIFEVHYDEETKKYRISDTKDDILENSKEDKEESLNNILDESNDELNNMFEEEEEKEELDNNLQKEEAKQLTKEFKSKDNFENQNIEEE